MNAVVAWARVLVVVVLVLPLPIVLILLIEDAAGLLYVPGMSLGYLLVLIGAGGAWSGKNRIADIGAGLHLVNVAFLVVAVHPAMVVIALPAGLLLFATRSIRRRLAPLRESPMPSLADA